MHVSVHLLLHLVSPKLHQTILGFKFTQQQGCGPLGHLQNFDEEKTEPMNEFMFKVSFEYIQVNSCLSQLLHI